MKNIVSTLDIINLQYRVATIIVAVNLLDNYTVKFAKEQA